MTNLVLYGQITATPNYLLQSHTSQCRFCRRITVGVIQIVPHFPGCPWFGGTYESTFFLHWLLGWYDGREHGPVDKSSNAYLLGYFLGVLDAYRTRTASCLLP